MQRTTGVAVIRDRRRNPAATVVGRADRVVANVDRVRDGRVGVDPTPGFGRRQVVAG